MLITSTSLWSPQICSSDAEVRSASPSFSPCLTDIWIFLQRLRHRSRHPNGNGRCVSLANSPCFDSPWLISSFSLFFYTRRPLQVHHSPRTLLVYRGSFFSSLSFFLARADLRFRFPSFLRKSTPPSPLLSPLLKLSNTKPSSGSPTQESISPTSTRSIG